MKQLYKTTTAEIQRAKHQLLRINVFLTKKEYSQLYELKYKYRLSFTYILKIIQLYYSVLKPINDKALSERLYKTTKTRKTSIKIFKNQANEEYNKSYYNNNLLFIYLNKLDKFLLDPKTYEKCRNMIANQLEITQDPFYNYNENYRQFIYMQKHIKQ